MKTFNKINLKEKFLKKYVKEATVEELKHFNTLLEQGDYQEIDKTIEEYMNNIINNQNLNDSSCSNLSSENSEIKSKSSNKEINHQIFELSCMLMLLIYKYQKEQNQDKKELLKIQIQSAFERYKHPEKIKKRIKIKNQDN